MNIFARRNKKKVCIELTKRNYDALRAYVEATGSTIGNITNYVIDMLNAPEPVLCALADHCAERISLTEDLLESSIDGISKMSVSVDLSAFQEMYSFLSGDYELTVVHNTEKQKCTVEITSLNFDLLSAYTVRKATTGRMINKLLSVALPPSREVFDDIASWATLQAQEISERMSYCGSFERQMLEDIRKYYQKFAFFYAYGDYIPTSVSSARRYVTLLNGSMSYPASWIAPEEASLPPEKSTHAIVVECRAEKWNGQEVPHFIFFGNSKVSELDEKEREEKLNACVKHFPLMADILANQVSPPSCSLGKEEQQKYLESPEIGFFDVRATDDEEHDPQRPQPFGCLIIRIGDD